MRRFLHIGPSKVGKDHAGLGFQSDDWQEVRLDLDPAARPDILANMTDMKTVASGSFDAIFSSHTIEHLYPDDVRKAFQECYRVLAPWGFMVMVCPDLQAVAEPIARGELLTVLYESNEGPVTPLDMLYGYRGYFTLPDRREVMTHHTGFTLPVMVSSLESIGFPTVVGRRRLSCYELWTFASKTLLSEEEIREQVGIHFSL